MSTSSLSGPFSAREQAQTNAGIFLFSGLVAQVALLLRLYALEKPLVIVVLLAFFIIAFGFAVLLMQSRVLQRKSGLIRVRQGFVISATGTLLLILTLHDLHNEWSLLPGIIISGLGQGMVYTALIRRGKKDGHVLRMRILAPPIAGSVLSVMAVLLTQSSFTGVTGFPYAFALLLDLSLLGALYVWIIEQEG